MGGVAVPGRLTGHGAGATVVATTIRAALRTPPGRLPTAGAIR
jgi:hypothetical protein